MKRSRWSKSIRYCLAYAAKRHGIVVHAACLMSTHAHEVITDLRGVYPKFLETFHRNLAVCTKAFRGWPEELELRLEMPVALRCVHSMPLGAPRESSARQAVRFGWPGGHPPRSSRCQRLVGMSVGRARLPSCGANVGTICWYDPLGKDAGAHELHWSAARRKSCACAKSVCPLGRRQHVRRLHRTSVAGRVFQKWRSVFAYKRASMRDASTRSIRWQRVTRTRSDLFRASSAYVIVCRELRCTRVL